MSSFRQNGVPVYRHPAFNNNNSFLHEEADKKIRLNLKSTKSLLYQFFNKCIMNQTKF